MLPRKTSAGASAGTLPLFILRSAQPRGKAAETPTGRSAATNFFITNEGKVSRLDDLVKSEIY
jgi:hypothetical protein